MAKRSLLAFLLLAFLPAVPPPALADQSALSPKIQEEVWVLPFPLPFLAYVVRPVGDGALVFRSVLRSALFFRWSSTGMLHFGSHARAMWSSRR